MVLNPGELAARGSGRYAIAEAEVQAYLDRFGDRCTQELKLESIPLSEEPGQLLAAIAASARRPSAAARRGTAPDWSAVMPGRPLRRWRSRESG